MSFRANAPRSADPDGLADILDDLVARVEVLEAVVARAALPNPLRFVATPGVGGTYSLAVVNDATGGAVVLGVI